MRQVHWCRHLFPLNFEVYDKVLRAKVSLGIHQLVNDPISFQLLAIHSLCHNLQACAVITTET